MSHYFDSPSQVTRRRRSVTLLDQRVDVTTAQGVFAQQGVDKGTAVLLRRACPSPQARTFLDLGCGWGPITLALALAHPKARITAVDVNSAALQVCGENARELGVADRVQMYEPDRVPDAARFDEIWSNPPIRVGKTVLHTLLNRWLPRLEPDGCARLVVNKNLGADSLQGWLVQQGYECVRTASTQGFRVLVVSKAENHQVGGSPAITVAR